MSAVSLYRFGMVFSPYVRKDETMSTWFAKNEKNREKDLAFAKLFSLPRKCSRRDQVVSGGAAVLAVASSRNASCSSVVRETT